MSEVWQANLGEDYQARPTSLVPVVFYEQEGDQMMRTLNLMRWGLLPFWAKDLQEGRKTFNARSETIATKPTFKDSFERRRCILPAQWFVEYLPPEPGKKRKRQIRFVSDDAETLSLAGLWSSWKSPTGERIQTATMVTTDPNSFVVDIHDRMPVILPPDGVNVWLDPSSSSDVALAVLRPYEGQLRIVDE